MLDRYELAGAVDDRLYFAQVREDPNLELAAFADCLDGPIAIVSSGGCTALSLLAHGATRVVGVDRNRTQNHVVEFKAATVANLDGPRAVALLGAAPQSAADRMRGYAAIRDGLTPAARAYWDAHPELVACGVLNAGETERLWRLIARSLRTFVHPPARIDRFLHLQTLDQQRDFYHTEWDIARWRQMFRVFCSKRALRSTSVPAFFADWEDTDFAEHFLRVAEHTLTTLPVGENYFLYHTLTGRYPETATPPYLAGRRPQGRLTLVDGGFADYLRTCTDHSLAGLALSNICEWLTPAQIDGLFGEIARTARPGARVVFRNFTGWTEVPERWRGIVREDRELGETLMAQDRSLCQRRFAVCTVHDGWPTGALAAPP